MGHLVILFTFLKHGLKIDYQHEMIRIKMEKRSKRERAENWTEEERNLLKNLVNERFDIIENKNTDTATNMQKLEAWKEIWERFVEIINDKLCFLYF